MYCMLTHRPLHTWTLDRNDKFVQVMKASLADDLTVFRLRV